MATGLVLHTEQYENYFNKLRKDLFDQAAEIEKEFDAYEFKYRNETKYTDFQKAVFKTWIDDRRKELVHFMDKVRARGMKDTVLIHFYSEYGALLEENFSSQEKLDFSVTSSIVHDHDDEIKNLKSIAQNIRRHYHEFAIHHNKTSYTINLPVDLFADLIKEHPSIQSQLVVWAYNQQ